jgi:hypothetical protein
MAGQSIFKISIKIGLWFLMVLFLIQCTAKPGVVVKEDENQTLRNRAGEYWNLLINPDPKNAEKLYLFEAPSFREKVAFVEYANRFRSTRYLEANVEAVKIEGQKGNVTVTASYVMFFPNVSKKKLTNTAMDRWVRVDGTWYHIPREWVMPG